MTSSTAVHDVATGALRTLPHGGECAEEVREALQAGLLVVGPGDSLDLTDDGRALLGLEEVDAEGHEIGGGG